MERNPRLFYPLESGTIPFDVPPEGTCIWRARPSFEFSDFRGLQVLQSFKPAALQLEAMGLNRIKDEPGNLDLAIVQITRSKTESLALIGLALDALKPGGWCIVDGLKTDGIDSIYKMVRQAMDGAESYSKAHGRAFWFQKPEKLPDAITDWKIANAAMETDDGYITSPGIFSEKGADEGSQVLLDHLPASLSGTGADLGAGWGWLSAELLKKCEGIESISLFEAEGLALTCAVENVPHDRASFHWSDVTKEELGEFDFVVMNPPFHQKRKAEPELGAHFIRAAARSLRRSGVLYMVANRQLPYESALSANFGQWSEIGTTPRFKVIHAKKPKR